MGQVHWQMGQVLLPEHFKMQQQHAHALSAHISALSFDHQDGLVNFSIDQAALSNGILKVTDLALFLPDMSFALSNFNASCQPFELDPDLAESSKLSLYLTLSNKQKIEAETLNNVDIETEQYQFHFKHCFDADALYSIKLLDLQYDEEQLEWKFGDYIPKHVFLPKLYASHYINLALDGLMQFRKLLKLKCSSQNMHYRYQSLFLKIAEIEFWLQLQKSKDCSVRVSDFEIQLHSLYQAISLFFNNLTCYYRPDKNSLKNCQALLSLIDKALCDDHSPQLERHVLNFNNGIYKSGILNDHFFTSEKKYLVIEVSDHSNEILCKAFAPSRAHDVLLRSLPGVELLSVNPNELKDHFPNAHQVMEVISTGPEWDAVINEKVLCIKGSIGNNDECQIYLAGL